MTDESSTNPLGKNRRGPIPVRTFAALGDRRQASDRRCREEGAFAGPNDRRRKDRRQTAIHALLWQRQRSVRL